MREKQGVEEAEPSPERRHHIEADGGRDPGFTALCQVQRKIRTDRKELVGTLIREMSPGR